MCSAYLGTIASNILKRFCVCRKIRCLKWVDPRWRSWLSHCARMSPVWFPMRSLRIFTELILPTAWSRISLWEECVSGRCLGLTNFPTFMYRFSRNLGASTSWNPQVLSSSVQGLLYRVWRGITDGQVVPVYTSKTYRGRKAVVSVILDLCTRWQ